MCANGGFSGEELRGAGERTEETTQGDSDERGEVEREAEEHSEEIRCREDVSV